MSRIRADRIVDRAATGAPLFPNGAVITGVATATTFSGNATTATTATNAQGLTGSPNISVGTITATGNVSIAGTLTYEDVTNVDSVGLVTARSGLRVVGGGATVTGVTTFFNDIRVKGVIENVSAAPTFFDATGKVGLELDLLASTTYSYAIQPANIGVVSFKNMPADAQGGATVTVLFTQASATTGGVGNTTFNVGLGTVCTVIPNVGGAAQTGISTRAFVGAGATFVGLSTTPGDKEFVSFFVHYNGGTNTNANSYDVFVTKNGQFRPSVVGV